MTQKEKDDKSQIIEEENQIKEYRENISKLKKNEEIYASLVMHTFSEMKGKKDKKGNSLIPQALMEGQMKGFSIEDFMKGNVYALPFYSSNDNAYTYSLTTSIDYMRKQAMRSGQTGKSSPEYTFVETENKKENKRFGEQKPETCTVTVWKEGGHDKGFSATVYFDEYDTGKNLWYSKPKTMIAKVAEMHALRMAFPQELQNHYIAEEKEKDLGAVEVNFEEEQDWSREEIDNIDTMEDLQKHYKENKGKGKEFAKYITKRKKELKNNQSQDENS